jgi:threonine aldolase
MSEAMLHPLVDLRSDTVTRPTPAMRRAMAEAEVGDDVYSEDPTVNRLQSRVAEIFGREASLFFPTGSMANLTAIKTWTQPGMEVICEAKAHIYLYEMASVAALAGCMPNTTPAPDGILTWDLIEPLIRPHIYYRAQTGMIELENTHNMHGGSVYPQEIVDDICERAHAKGIPVHLDGARIFNASAASGRSVADLTRKFDSVMFCLSKALGAPVGSMLVGSHDFIEKARVNRKLFGGGMRQAGILAAAGLVALEESPELLKTDHDNAKRLAQGLAGIRGVSINADKVVTNIVFCDVGGTRWDAAGLCAELAKQNILCGAMEKARIRMVTHYDVDRAGIDRTLAAFSELCAAA